MNQKIKPMNKIAIVTPLYNELDNITPLIESIKEQTHEILYWVIVENDSTDGSRERLEELVKVENVKHLIILNYESSNKSYDLGIKVANVIDFGFSYLRSMDDYHTLDYIGILDADCFPEPTYYESLISFMEARPTIGISSGVIYTHEGKRDFVSKDWVRGSGRLWTKACFDDSGYIIGPSSDTLSTAKAILNGWEVIPNQEIKILSREVGSRVQYDFYGYSAYYRGITLPFILLRTLKYLFFFRYRTGYEQLRGYLKSYFKGDPKIDDIELKTYYQNYFWIKLKQRFKRSKR